MSDDKILGYDWAAIQRAQRQRVCQPHRIATRHRYRAQGGSMIDTSHLDALQLRLSHEHSYLAAAKSAGERELRSVWIAQIEREIVCELGYFGIVLVEVGVMSDDELLRELGG